MRLGQSIPFRTGICQLDSSIRAATCRDWRGVLSYGVMAPDELVISMPVPVSPVVAVLQLTLPYWVPSVRVMPAVRIFSTSKEA